MEKSNNNPEDLTQKVLEGLRLSFKKLVLQLRKDDEELIFSRDGKIVRVKARDIEV